MSEKVLLPREDWLKTLPRKRMAAACLLELDGKFLIVKPNYRDWWLLPGGGMDELESPLGTMQRELKEELGLEIRPTRLLVVDYRQEPNAKTAADEKVDFLFYAPLTPAQFNAIVLQADELTGMKLVMATELDSLLSLWQARRVQTGLVALRENRTIYAQEGVGMI